jgi:hypothetical protein
VFHGRGLATANGIDLIAAIYDAALDSERWPLVLDRLAETLGASAGTLIRQNLITAKGKMIATRVDPKFGQPYNDHYSSLNILPNRAGRPPVGTCLTDRMIVRREEFVRTEFYSDFMRPWGFIISSVLKVHIFMEGDYEIYVSFGRSATANGSHRILNCFAVLHHIYTALLRLVPFSPVREQQSVRSQRRWPLWGSPYFF